MNQLMNNTNYKKLYRSINDRKIAGVCGGLGEYFTIDPTIVRVLFVALLVLGGSGLLLYLLLWLIVPDGSQKFYQ
ncbi:PspC domain-containing protein [Bacteroidales bacterium OttesenSCG-928-B11]|nr:PspC domain-containing protein [Bacteroidales bacterium OttesenSCG-928-B11]